MVPSCCLWSQWNNTTTALRRVDDVFCWRSNATREQERTMTLDFKKAHIKSHPADNLKMALIPFQPQFAGCAVVCCWWSSILLLAQQLRIPWKDYSFSHLPFYGGAVFVAMPLCQMRPNKRLYLSWPWRLLPTHRKHWRITWQRATKKNFELSRKRKKERMRKFRCVFYQILVVLSFFCLFVCLDIWLTLFVSER